MQKLISENVVAVFSKSYCPYCKAAKQLLSSIGLDQSKIGVLELDEMNEGADVQNYLQQKTGQRTVPNIFIYGQHIGGSDSLSQAQSSGELKKLLKL